MYLGFALDLPDIDLRNIFLSDTSFDLLHTDLPSKHFVLSARRLQDIFSVTIFRLHITSSRRLGRCPQDVFARHLQDVFARRLQAVFDNKKLLR